MITRRNSLIDETQSSESNEDGAGLNITNGEDQTEGTSFEEDWDHPNHAKRVKWREAIDKELKSMEQYGVWEIIIEKDMPPGRIPIEIN